MRANGNPPVEPVPDWFDYEMWTGPAPLRPSDGMPHLRWWRTFTEYGNGIGSGAGGGTNFISTCPAGQCATLLSGNANLTPEIADSFSVGGLLNPTALHGFTASVAMFEE